MVKQEPSDSVLLEVRNLSVTFQSQEGCVTAVDNLNFQLHKSETLGIVGESGSGKSVTSLAIMGLIQTPPGKVSAEGIYYNNKNLLTIKEKDMRNLRGNEIAMIFQEPMTSLNPILTCGFQIAESLRLHRGLNKKESRKETIRLVDNIGIPNPEKSINRFPHELSGGMRQRVMIAMALACEPKILIADEPTTALDVTIQAQILELMGKLSREKHTSIIIITHDLGVVSEISDRVLVMYSGHSVEIAPTKELFSNPLHPYTKGLIATIPEITKEKIRLKEIPGMAPNPTEKPEGCSFNPRCKYVIDKCKTDAPTMEKISKDHYVRCWLYGDKNE